MNFLRLATILSAILILTIGLIPIYSQVKEKKSGNITITFLIDEDSDIFIGLKRIKFDDIPKEGIILNLEIKGNRIEKIIFQEEKK